MTDISKKSIGKFFFISICFAPSSERRKEGEGEDRWNGIPLDSDLKERAWFMCFFFSRNVGNSVEEIKDNLYLRDAVYISYWSWYLQRKKIIHLY